MMYYDTRYCYCYATRYRYAPIALFLVHAISSHLVNCLKTLANNQYLAILVISNRLTIDGEYLCCIKRCRGCYVWVEYV